MLNATLIRRIEITRDLLIFHIRPDEPIHDFLPGQYVALGLPGSAPRRSDMPAEIVPHDPEKLIKRAYSIGSSPNERAYLEFYLAVLPQGALTARLAALPEGGRLYCAPKISGAFTLHDVPDSANLVLVATGTGLAPFLSMIRTPATWTPCRKITIIHGVRYVPDLAFQDELLALAEKNRNFRYFSVVSRPDEKYRGEKGYVQRFLNEGSVVLEPTTDHLFLCGNPAMIEDMETLLKPRGYTEHTRKHPGNLHLEKYW